MARTKQATPLRREPSSEYTSKADRNGAPSHSARSLDKAFNGIVTDHTHAEEVLKSMVPEFRKEAGAFQFLVAVGGIYGSLYVQEL